MPVFSVTEDDKKRLALPIKNTGGWQSLLLRLRKGVEEDRIVVSDEDLETIRTYRKNYGEAGGYQNRIPEAVWETTSRPTNDPVPCLDSFVSDLDLAARVQEIVKGAANEIEAMKRLRNAFTPTPSVNVSAKDDCFEIDLAWNSSGPKQFTCSRK